MNLICKLFGHHFEYRNYRYRCKWCGALRYQWLGNNLTPELFKKCVNKIKESQEEVLPPTEKPVQETTNDNIILTDHT